MGTRPRQIVFTSGATESVNAAVWAATREHPDGAVALAGVEHSSVRQASERLARVVTLPVDGLGRILHDAVEDAVTLAQGAGTPLALVHCQAANHEVGTLQPVREVVAMCRAHGVLVHVDAAAAVGHVELDLDELGADLVSVSAHKLGGPPGIGALVVRRGLRFPAFVVGGARSALGARASRTCLLPSGSAQPQGLSPSLGVCRAKRRSPGASRSR